jgi:hypothetical protein
VVDVKRRLLRDCHDAGSLDLMLHRTLIEHDLGLHERRWSPRADDLGVLERWPYPLDTACAPMTAAASTSGGPS